MTATQPVTFTRTVPPPPEEFYGRSDGVEYETHLGPVEYRLRESKFMGAIVHDNIPSLEDAVEIWAELGFERVCLEAVTEVAFHPGCQRVVTRFGSKSWDQWRIR